MQVKVREMKAEITRLSEQAEAGEREKSAKKHYEKRVKELALELTGTVIYVADLIDMLNFFRENRKVIVTSSLVFATKNYL